MSSIAGSQARTFLQLLEEMLPLIRGNRNLPAWIQTRLAKEKRFGSRDRRLYRELLYTAIRFLPWIEELRGSRSESVLEAVVSLAAEIPALSPLKAQLPPGRMALAQKPIVEKAALLQVAAPLMPDWLAEQCPAANESPNLDAIHTRAPLWLRLNIAQPIAVWNEFRERGWAWRESSLLSGAVEVIGDVDVTQTTAYEKGWIEVQDLGSQLTLRSVPISASARWLDACAGAGGKSLQLASLLGPEGEVVAHDVRSDALAELVTRARRAGIRNITTARVPTGEFDGVLVDAPCSGSGTWRRSPHLKWCTTGDTLKRSAGLQGELLLKFSRHVRPGGLLVYATCSLARIENQDAVGAFLKAAPDFQEIPSNRLGIGTAQQHGTQFLPATHNGDGFFVAALRRS